MSEKWIHTGAEYGHIPYVHPDRYARIEHAWLSPDGKLFDVFYPINHGPIAREMGFDGEKAMSALGWCKLVHERWFIGDNDVTQPQIDAILGWCLQNEQPAPYFVESRVEPTDYRIVHLEFAKAKAALPWDREGD